MSCNFKIVCSILGEMKNLLFPIRKTWQVKTWITPKSDLVNQWVYWDYFQEQEWMSQNQPLPPQHGWQTAHESWNPTQPSDSMVGWGVLWESSVGLSFFFQTMLPPGQLLWEWLAAIFTVHISMQREAPHESGQFHGLPEAILILYSSGWWRFSSQRKLLSNNPSYYQPEM